MTEAVLDLFVGWSGFVERAIVAMLIVVGLVNAFPVLGVASAEMLARLYGIPELDGDLLILMRHRALLFGILGVLILASAFKHDLRGAAAAAGLVSMLGFVALAWIEGGVGPEVGKVVVVDVVASIALVVVWTHEIVGARSSRN